jgi:hypothetical protein
MLEERFGQAVFSTGTTTYGTDESTYFAVEATEEDFFRILQPLF